MKIGELADRVGVTTSRIRFYEKSGLIEPARRWDNGYRDYSPDDVSFLKLVLTAQDLGFSLREIKEMAPGLREPTQGCSHAIERLRAKRIEIGEKIVEMRNLEKNLGELITKYEAYHADAEVIDSPPKAATGD